MWRTELAFYFIRSLRYCSVKFEVIYTVYRRTLLKFCLKYFYAPDLVKVQFDFPRYMRTELRFDYTVA